MKRLLGPADFFRNGIIKKPTIRRWPLVLAAWYVLLLPITPGTGRGVFLTRNGEFIITRSHYTWAYDFKYGSTKKVRQNN